MHPSDATLLALLHGELGDALRAETQEHVGSCAACSAKLAELRDGDATVARLLATLDHPVPRRLPPVAVRGPRLTRGVLAASIALLVAGAAAAAVPGTPVHRWIQEQLGTTAARESHPSPSAPEPAAPAPTAEQAASGIEVPVAGALTVSFAQPEEGGTLVVASTDRANVSLRAFGGGVAYRVGAGRIVVDNRRAAGRYELEVPNTLEQLSVLLGTQVIFRSGGGRIGSAGRDTISLAIDRAQP